MITEIVRTDLTTQNIKILNTKKTDFTKILTYEQYEKVINGNAVKVGIYEYMERAAYNKFAKEFIAVMKNLNII